MFKINEDDRTSRAAKDACMHRQDIEGLKAKIDMCIEQGNYMKAAKRTITMQRLVGAPEADVKEIYDLFSSPCAALSQICAFLQTLLDLHEKHSSYRAVMSGVLAEPGPILEKILKLLDELHLQRGGMQFPHNVRKMQSELASISQLENPGAELWQKLEAFQSSIFQQNRELTKAWLDGRSIVLKQLAETYVKTVRQKRIGAIKQKALKRIGPLKKAF